MHLYCLALLIVGGFLCPNNSVTIDAKFPSRCVAATSCEENRLRILKDKPGSLILFPKFCMGPERDRNRACVEQKRAEVFV
jgi:hypothetical protein